MSLNPSRLIFLNPFSSFTNPLPKTPKWRASLRMVCQLVHFLLQQEKEQTFFPISAVSTTSVSTAVQINFTQALLPVLQLMIAAVYDSLLYPRISIILIPRVPIFQCSLPHSYRSPKSDPCCISPLAPYSNSLFFSICII